MIEDRDLHAFRKEKVSFGFMQGFAWAIILICPKCRKVVGTHSYPPPFQAGNDPEILHKSQLTLRRTALEYQAVCLRIAF